MTHEASTFAPADEQGLMIGPVQISPGQHWLFEWGYLNYYNMVLLMEERQRLDPALLERAFRALLEHHDGLRARFTHTEDGWRQTIGAPEAQLPFYNIDLSPLAPAAQDQALEDATLDFRQRLNIVDGPVIQLAYFTLGVGRPGRLLLTISHTVVDAHAVQVLTEDLLSAYRQLARGEALALPAKTTSFQRWMELLVAHALSPQITQDLGSWTELDWAKTARIPLDFPQGLALNRQGSGRKVERTLEVAETRALMEMVPWTLDAKPANLLLWALAKTFDRWLGTRAIQVCLVGRGRDPIFSGVDLSRTVAYLTFGFQHIVDLGPEDDLYRELQAIRAQLRSVPNKGLSYDLLRLLNTDPAIKERMQAIPHYEMVFNYLGQTEMVSSASSEGEALVRTIPLPFRPIADFEQPRHTVLAWTVEIFAGRLKLSIEYSEQLHERATVEWLADLYMGTLRSLLELDQLPAALEPAELAQGCTLFSLPAGVDVGSEV